MFLQDAVVHHHEDSRLARLLRRFLMDHFFLHPDRGNFQLDCLIDHFLNKFRSGEKY